MNHTAPTHRPRAARRRTAPQRRGIAMLLVLGVVVMGSVLGYAMLSSAALQKQASSNGSAAACAQGMAESGVNLAIYYLQNPDKAPGYPATYPSTELYDREGKFWTGTPNDEFVDFGSPSVGSVKVKVTRPDPSNRWQYEIESTGRTPGGTLERKVIAAVYVNAEYRFEHAAVFTNDVTLSSGTRVGQSGQNNGDAYSNGGLAIRSGGAVYGRGTRRKIVVTAVNPLAIPAWQTPPPRVPKVVPASIGEIRNYETYELPKGTVNNAGVLTSVTDIGAGYPTQRLDPAPGNAAGVYYVPGNLTLRADAEVRGTLIVQGNLSVVGTNIRLRSVDGFPALIVGGNVSFSSLTTSDMTVEGVTYVGGRVDAGALIPTLTVTGALLVGGTSPIFPSSPAAKLYIYHDTNRTRIPDFSELGRTPTSVKVLAWQGQ